MDHIKGRPDRLCWTSPWFSWCLWTFWKARPQTLLESLSLKLQPKGRPHFSHMHHEDVILAQRNKETRDSDSGGVWLSQLQSLAVPKCVHYPMRHVSKAADFCIVLFTPLCCSESWLWRSGRSLEEFDCVLVFLLTLSAISSVILTPENSTPCPFTLCSSLLSDLNSWGKIISGFPSLHFYDRGPTLRILTGHFFHLTTHGLSFNIVIWSYHFWDEFEDILAYV